MFQNHWEIVHKLQEIHQQDLLREAQQLNFYKQMIRSNAPVHPFTWRLFSWLGSQMVILGSQLQQHYAELTEIRTDFQANLSEDEACGC
ncbi:MAG: hypothetical protein P4L50_14240 [Anaerolineaceae bacterium]|nr:hypothetical protein [Anaerolineaceae bacterium]